MKYFNFLAILLLSAVSSTGTALGASIVACTGSPYSTLNYISANTTNICTPVINGPRGGSVVNKSVPSDTTGSIANITTSGDYTITCTGATPVTVTLDYQSTKVWNGSSCVVPTSCALPWGGTLASGSSVTAYNVSSVASGGSCSGSGISQTRTCTTNGVLSGSYTNKTCNVQPATVDLSAGPASPTVGVAGTAVNFTATIFNKGNGSTGVRFSNFFQVATAENGGGTTSDLLPKKMSAIAGEAQSTAISPPYTFPSSGVYSVRVCADKSSSSDSGKIPETDEENNCGKWTSIAISSAGSSSECTNGATDYPGCISCNNGYTYAFGQCYNDCANGAVNPPTCTNSCTSGAINPPACDTCPPGQSMVSSGSCVASQAQVTSCGDNKCDTGETLLSCPQDCKGKIQQF